MEAEGGEVHAAGARGGFGEGLGAGDECWWNAPGMSDEAFLEAACSTRADVAPGEITGSSFHHCLPFFYTTHTHRTQIRTHIPVEHSPLYDHQGGKV